MWPAGPDTHKHTSVGLELQVDFVFWLEKWGDSSNTLLLPSLPIFFPPLACFFPSFFVALHLPLFLSLHVAVLLGPGQAIIGTRKGSSEYLYCSSFCISPGMLTPEFIIQKTRYICWATYWGYFLVSYQTVAPRFQAPTMWCLQSVLSYPFASSKPLLCGTQVTTLGEPSGKI